MRRSNVFKQYVYNNENFAYVLNINRSNAITIITKENDRK